MAKRMLAFVLSGGGARGALQVGALRALLEGGQQPDLLVGTSIGACNAAYLAMHGVNLSTIDGLANLWRDAVKADLLPPNYLWLTVSSLMRRTKNGHSEARMRDFCLAHGMRADLLFSDIRDVRLTLVAADLNSGQSVVYSAPEENVLEAMVASAALPPWIGPVQRGEQLLVDGGMLSNLPVETALVQGAGEIVALNLANPFEGLRDAVGFGPGLRKALAAVQQRQMDLELRLAAAYNVPVLVVELGKAANRPALWDFSRTEELMDQGYAVTRAALAGRTQSEAPIRWWTSPDWFVRSARRWAPRRKAA
jgi:NTE family protein